MVWFLFALVLVRVITSDGSFAISGYLVANPLHRACDAWRLWRELDPIYSALFCASNSLSSEIKTLFQETGLYHLIVVSGSHLIFFENILQRIFRDRWRLHLLLLLMFCLACQAQPPLTRALLSLFLTQASRHYRLFWSHDLIICKSGLLCLLIFPEWVTSLSLLLSWLASLALQRPAPWRLRSFQVAGYMTIWTGSLKGEFILNNMVFGFIFENLLFPLSLFFFLVPTSTTFGNALWARTTGILQHFPASEPLAPGAPTTLVFWFFVGGLHLFHRSHTWFATRS